MKKSKLMKELHKLAKTGGADLHLVRQGSSHEWWSINGQRFAVPRHNDVNEFTAKGIIKKVKEQI